MGSIPTGGALAVWPWTFGSRTAWLVNKSAGQPQFYDTIAWYKVVCTDAALCQLSTYLELQTYHKYVLICNMFVLGMYLVYTSTNWFVRSF